MRSRRIPKSWLVIPQSCLSLEGFGSLAKGLRWLPQHELVAIAPAAGGYTLRFGNGVSAVAKKVSPDLKGRLEQDRLEAVKTCVGGHR
eukprot:COSAG04_NODE_1_length_58448_cov_23.476478_33_plen_88_part_00